MYQFTVLVAAAVLAAPGDESPGEKAIPKYAARIVSVADLDAIELKHADGKVETIQLANVLPFSAWKEKPDLAVDKMRTEISRTLVNSLVNLGSLKTAADGERRTTQLSWFAGSQPEGFEWSGKRPSESFGWGMTNLGVFVVENGWSPYVFTKGSSPHDVARFIKAEQLAKTTKRGLWASEALAREASARAMKAGGKIELDLSGLTADHLPHLLQELRECPESTRLLAVTGCAKFLAKDKSPALLAYFTKWYADEPAAAVRRAMILGVKECPKTIAQSFLRAAIAQEQDSGLRDLASESLGQL